METNKFDWSVLKRLSAYAFVVSITLSVLDWIHYDQVELFVNDAAAKASWLLTRRLYERTGIAAFAVAIGLRFGFLDH